MGSFFMQHLDTHFCSRRARRFTFSLCYLLSIIDHCLIIIIIKVFSLSKSVINFKKFRSTNAYTIIVITKDRIVITVFFDNFSLLYIYTVYLNKNILIQYQTIISVNIFAIKNEFLLCLVNFFLYSFSYSITILLPTARRC